MLSRLSFPAHFFTTEMGNVMDLRKAISFSPLNSSLRNMTSNGLLLCRRSFNPHFKNKAHGLRFVASWYCDSCSVVLCGVQFVLFCVFTLLFPHWHFWPPAARFRLDFKWGEKIMSKYWLVWRPQSSPSPRKGCHCSCLSGSLPEFKVFRLLHAGSAYNVACRRKYRPTKDWKELQMGTAGLSVWVPQSRPSRLTLQGCMAVCWRSQKIWGIWRLIPAERKFSCRGN